MVIEVGNSFIRTCQIKDGPVLHSTWAMVGWVHPTGNMQGVSYSLPMMQLPLYGHYMVRIVVGKTRLDLDGSIMVALV